MPKKNFRSLFRGSRIRISFFIQTGKNIYLTSSRHRLVEGHSPEGQGCGHPHHRQGHQHQVRVLLRQDRGRNEHPGTLRRFRRRAPGAGGVFFCPHAKKESPAALVMLQGFSQDGDYLLSHLRSTIGVTKLNFSVRNGKRWNLRAIVT